LRISYPCAEFGVYTNACKEGLDGVLIQNGHVVCYESRKLKEYENIYSMCDLELAAIVHALNMWWHYIMGNKFALRIDHCALNYLFGQPILNAKQSRWLEFLSEYDFNINHIIEKENKVVETLNKRMHEMYATTISMYRTDLHEIFLEVSKLDLRYMDINVTLQQGTSQPKFEYYELREDGILMYRCRVYVPNHQELKNLILSKMHKVSYVGHPGYQKTIVIFKKQYFWPGMKK
jgi:hypothetical protein